MIIEKPSYLYLEVDHWGDVIQNHWSQQMTSGSRLFLAEAITTFHVDPSLIKEGNLMIADSMKESLAELKAKHYHEQQLMQASIDKLLALEAL